MTDPRDDERSPPMKSYRTILKQEIVTGLIEFRRPARGLFLSSLSAGLSIGFSVLLMGVSWTLFSDVLDGAWLHALLANMYSVGFILVILGRSELFTEHTALAVLPVLDGRQSVGSLTRVWGIVFAGNILGAAFFASVLQWVAPQMGIIDPRAFAAIAEKLTAHSWWVILLSALLAGWLMGELAWLIGAARDTISQVVCIWVVTMTIGYAELHHSIVGTVEVLAGVLSSQSQSWSDLSRFLFWTTIGNALGGVLFVAIIKYGHAVSSTEEQELEDVDLKRRS